MRKGIFSKYSFLTNQSKFPTGKIREQVSLIKHVSANYEIRTEAFNVKQQFQ